MNQRDPHRPANAFSSYESFGNYILLKKLATGGMAEVFLARPATHRGNGRVQVIKRILPHVANDVSFLRMFQSEIQVCMGFNHPHTVQLHDFGEANRQPYISMEYIEGKNLKDVMTKFVEKGEMPSIPMVLSLMAQAASGLHYAHTFVNKVTGDEVRAIHRDISPQNLIVSYEGNLKVIDFGIAKAASGMQESTRAGTIKGKFAYLSPEQVSGSTIDGRVDIFALGIVAWEMLTLRRPFYRNGDSELTILGTITNCDFHIKAPSYYNGAVPPEVDQIILKALRKDPNERFSSADELQVALRKVMQTHYPEYSYSENAKIMQALFQDEIAQERNEIRVLNLDVQLHLSNSDATVVSGPTMITSIPMGEAQPADQQAKVMGIEMDFRLREIEAMMKKKASARHYVIFAFYLVSLIVLKLDDSYALFEFLLPQAKIADTANPGANTASVEKSGQVRAPARTKPQQQRLARNKAKAEHAKKNSARRALATQETE